MDSAIHSHDAGYEPATLVDQPEAHKSERTATTCLDRSGMRLDLAAASVLQRVQCYKGHHLGPRWVLYNDEENDISHYILSCWARESHTSCYCMQQ